MAELHQYEIEDMSRKRTICDRVGIKRCAARGHETRLSQRGSARRDGRDKSRGSVHRRHTVEGVQKGVYRISAVFYVERHEGKSVGCRDSRSVLRLSVAGTRTGIGPVQTGRDGDVPFASMSHRGSHDESTEGDVLWREPEAMAGRSERNTRTEDRKSGSGT